MPVRLLSSILFFFLFNFSVSCKGKKGSESGHEGRYGIVIFAGEDLDEEYFLQTPSLSHGEVTIPENALEIHSMIFANRDGYYYGIDDSKSILSQYRPTEKGLVKSKSVPFDRKSWKIYDSWYNWIDNRKLLVGSSMDGEQFTYKLIDVVDMKILSSGSIDVPKPPKGKKYGGVIGEFRDNRIFIAYTFFEGWLKKVCPSDTTYMAVVDYPSMKTQSLSKDSRATWPGGIYLHAPYSFQQNGDIYFMAAPGNRTYSHPTSVSGIFRIKKGQEQLDKDYFFEVTDNKSQESYLLYNLGNDKALVRMVDKNRVHTYLDYLNGYIARYYLLDLKNQTKTLLDMPYSALAFTECVLVENGKAYIAVSENKKESFVWEYDIVSGKLKKGLKVEGRILELHRLAKD